MTTCPQVTLTILLESAFFIARVLADGDDSDPNEPLGVAEDDGAEGKGKRGKGKKAKSGKPKAPKAPLGRVRKQLNLSKKDKR